MTPSRQPPSGTLDVAVRTLFRLAIVIVVAGLGLAAIGVAVVPQVAQIVTANHAEATDLPAFNPLAQRSLVYDRAGNLIDIFKAENRAPFTLAQVPKDVVDAVLAVEDESFYTHKGVNLKSLVRAMLVNVSAGEVTQGGSTITQQLVKNSLLTSARDADRKILEASYAVRLERQMSKDQILERYLNTVYLGNNAYGLQAAAETYFGKNVDQLDLWEGAFLAGLIRNPSGYDPIAHPERARARVRPAGGRRGGGRPPRGSGQAHARASDGGRRAVAAAGQAAVDAADGRAPVVLHRGGAQAAPQRHEDPR
jgi:membrane peptidoglycan carboxypeptidase